MRKYILAAVVAACLCFTACSEAENTDGETASSESEITASAVTDEEHIEAAKQTATDWFALMSEGKYSSANELMTEAFSFSMGYDKLEDGENVSEILVEFDDGGEFITEDGEGNTAVMLKTLAYKDGYKDAGTESYVLVSCVDGEYLISDAADVDNVDTETHEYKGYIESTWENMALYYAYWVYGYANEYYTAQQEDGKTVAAGNYNSEDGSDMTKYIQEKLDKAIDIDDYSYEYTVGEDGAESAKSAFEIYGKSYSGVYPTESA